MEIIDLVLRDWDVVGGRSSMMLRHLRDELRVACEQQRFAGLFKIAARERQHHAA
jgi:hypothetical protein